MKSFLKLFLLLFLLSCSNNEDPQEQNDFINAVDISLLPKIEMNNPIFKDNFGVQMPFLEILKLKGINTIRLRLWVNPINEHSSFDEVKSFSDTLKSMGFNIYLTLHYSDTWADPGQQIIPQDWQNISYTTLKNRVYDYTKMVVQQINPDIIQIGNEINNGFLHLRAIDIRNPINSLSSSTKG